MADRATMPAPCAPATGSPIGSSSSASPARAGWARSTARTTTAGRSWRSRSSPRRRRQPRFAREAQVLAALSPPRRSCATSRTAPRTTAGAYLVDGVARGRDARATASAAGRLTVAETRRPRRSRVAEALGAAHARGVVHRDLKPSNLFLPGRRGRRRRAIRVLDFGIARPPGGATRAHHDGRGARHPGYMAPEQARGERDVDARADVFSLGCVLFECLTGRPPFAGDDTLAVLLKVVLEEAPRLPRAAPERARRARRAGRRPCSPRRPRSGRADGRRGGRRARGAPTPDAATAAPPARRPGAGRGSARTSSGCSRWCSAPAARRAGRTRRPQPIAARRDAAAEALARRGRRGTRARLERRSPTVGPAHAPARARGRGGRHRPRRARRALRARPPPAGRRRRHRRRRRPRRRRRRPAAWASIIDRAVRLLGARPRADAGAPSASTR